MTAHEWEETPILLKLGFDKMVECRNCGAQAGRRIATQQWKLICSKTEQDCEEEQRMAKIRVVHEC